MDLNKRPAGHIAHLHNNSCISFENLKYETRLKYFILKAYTLCSLNIISSKMHQPTSLIIIGLKDSMIVYKYKKNVALYIWK